MTVCKRVLYAGSVQGVGFRYTARHIAQQFPVAGYVRNLPNGKVELTAEGEPDQVDAFLAALAEQMAHYIDSQTVHEETPHGGKGFGIRV